MVTKTYTISLLCSACNSILDITEDRKCRKCGHDFGPPPPPDTDISLPDMDYHWIRPGEGAWLDGLFTAADLRRIADAIDGNAPQESPAPEVCPRCRGKGTEVLVDRPNLGEPITHVGRCTQCGGSGQGDK